MYAGKVVFTILNPLILTFNISLASYVVYNNINRNHCINHSTVSSVTEYDQINKHEQMSKRIVNRLLCWTWDKYSCTCWYNIKLLSIF